MPAEREARLLLVNVDFVKNISDALRHDSQTMRNDAFTQAYATRSQAAVFRVHTSKAWANSVRIVSSESSLEPGDVKSKPRASAHSPCIAGPPIGQLERC